jgi:hypothetical protein
VEDNAVKLPDDSFFTDKAILAVVGIFLFYLKWVAAGFFLHVGWKLLK